MHYYLPLNKIIKFVSKGCFVKSKVVVFVLVYHLRICSVVYYVAQHSILHTLHPDKIPLDHINRGRFLYKYFRQNINGCILVLEEAYYYIVLISQHCNYMFVNFMYFRILIC